jgi:hypothetical protein
MYAVSSGFVGIGTDGEMVWARAIGTQQGENRVSKMTADATESGRQLNLWLILGAKTAIIIIVSIAGWVMRSSSRSPPASLANLS